MCVCWVFQAGASLPWKNISACFHMRCSKHFFHRERETINRRTLRKLSNKRADRPYISRQIERPRHFFPSFPRRKSEKSAALPQNAFRQLFFSHWRGWSGTRRSRRIIFPSSPHRSHSLLHQRLTGSAGADPRRFAKKYHPSGSALAKCGQFVGESVTDSISVTYLRQLQSGAVSSLLHAYSLVTL